MLLNSRWIRISTLVCLTTCGLVHSANAQTSRRAEVEGYDLTALLDNRRLVQGSPRFAVRFDRHTYYFASRDAKRQFQRAPHRYAPVLSGDCVVCLAEHNVRIPGQPRFAAVHNGRLYLFPTAATKRTFLRSPGRYEAVDLAENGRSVVARVDHGRTIAGQPEWTAVFQGLRYQFASAAERQRFLRQPVRYIATVRRSPQVSFGTTAASRSFRPISAGAASRELTSLQIARGAAPSPLFQLGALRNGLTADLPTCRHCSLLHKRPVADESSFFFRRSLDVLTIYSGLPGAAWF